MPPTHPTVTERMRALLDEARTNTRARDELFRLIYPRLLRMAERLLPLSPSAEPASIINGAFLSLGKAFERLRFTDELHLMCVMRQHMRWYLNQRWQDRPRERVGVGVGIAADSALGAAPPVGDPLALSGDSAATLELWTTFRTAFERLPERHREVFWRHHFLEMEYEDIGKELGITSGNARICKARAHQRLRADLGESFRELFAS